MSLYPQCSEIKIKLTVSKQCALLIAHNLSFFLLHFITKDICLGQGYWGGVESSFIPAYWKAEFTACPPCDTMLIPLAYCYSGRTRAKLLHSSEQSLSKNKERESKNKLGLLA